MDSKTLKQKYIKFFEDRGHKLIPSASLIPKDGSTLFISAGMQPLIPYLIGREHPEGKRLVNVQKCLRTDDIDEVGDNFHHTFFEMLGNWSFGDYFKEESISWSWEFLTAELGLAADKLAVTVFAGDQDAPKDEESVSIWKSLGIPDARIILLGKKDNWWGPVTDTGPCGPDTEIFYWTGDSESEGTPASDPRWVEIWNNVFMQYNKTINGKYEPLSQKNVDTGMGVERMVAVLQGRSDNYLTEIFLPIIQKIEQLTKKDYSQNLRLMRRIADHIRAATFIIADGVTPSNTERGYVLRRLVRRALRFFYQLGSDTQDILELAKLITKLYTSDYPKLPEQLAYILEVLTAEQQRFLQPINKIEQYRQDLEQAIRYGVVKKIGPTPILNPNGVVSGEYVFENYQSYGVPPDLAMEVVKELDIDFDKTGYETAAKKHQARSQSASAGVFKAGLASTGEIETRYHTATHLLHAALRQILGGHVIQRGSNITLDRLRFDFSHHEKLTPQQIKQVEDLVNQKIQEDLSVTHQEMDRETAEGSGAIHAFGEKYGEKVMVYTIGSFSREFCGGPHVTSTGVLGKFKIQKEESAGSGIRRIYATLS